MFAELAGAVSHAVSHLFHWFHPVTQTVGHGLPSHDQIWTFAYGANMGSAKLNHLGIHPSETVPAALPHYELVFDKSLADGTSEPAFANIRYIHGPYEPPAVAPVQGVLHAVNQHDLDTLDLSEQPFYHRVQLPVYSHTDHGHERVMAWTYVGSDENLGPSVDARGQVHMPLGRVEEGAPSERYAKLVVCGAKERGLPDWYTKRLEEDLHALGLPNRHFSCHHLQPHATTAAMQSTMSHVAAAAFLFVEVPLRSSQGIKTTVPR